MQLPKYLRRSPQLKLDCIMKNGAPFTIHDVAQLTSWPSPDQLALGESQYAALQHVFTSELAIIQGPPGGGLQFSLICTAGTGKTYIGYQIAKVLLANEHKWNSQKTHPILVVCYTNHALDQFLEGLAEFIETIDDTQQGRK
jgi:hypothetical protein